MGNGLHLKARVAFSFTGNSAYERPSGTELHGAHVVREFHRRPYLSA